MFPTPHTSRRRSPAAGIGGTPTPSKPRRNFRTAILDFIETLLCIPSNSASSHTINGGAMYYYTNCRCRSCVPTYPYGVYHTPQSYSYRSPAARPVSPSNISRRNTTSRLPRSATFSSNTYLRANIDFDPSDSSLSLPTDPSHEALIVGPLSQDPDEREEEPLPRYEAVNMDPPPRYEEIYGGEVSEGESSDEGY